MSMEMQNPVDDSVGVLGHIAIHALRGAVRGLQAQQAAQQAAAPPPAPVVRPVVKPAVSRPVAAAPRLPATRDDLARARLYAFSVRALQVAHALGHPDEDPKAAQRALLAAARSQQVAQKLKEMGIQQDGHADTFEEARERNLDKKLARSQVLLIASPDSGVDIFDIPVELQRSVAAVLRLSEFDEHPASGRIWGAPPAKSRKEK